MWAAAGGVVGSVAAAAPPSPAGTRSRRGAPAPCRAAAPQASPVLERAGTGPETARQGARQPSAARRRRTVDGSSVSSSSVTAAAHWQLPWQQREQVAEGPALAFAGAGAAAPSFEQRPRAAAQRGSSAAGAAGGLSVQLNEPPPRPAVDEATQLGQEQAGEAGSSSSGGSPGDDPGGEKEFFANVGDAIRTLREDYPLLLVKDLNCECRGSWAAAAGRQPSQGSSSAEEGALVAVEHAAKQVPACPPAPAPPAPLTFSPIPSPPSGPPLPCRRHLPGRPDVQGPQHHLHRPQNLQGHLLGAALPRPPAAQGRARPRAAHLAARGDGDQVSRRKAREGGCADRGSGRVAAGAGVRGRAHAGMRCCDACAPTASPRLQAAAPPSPAFRPASAPHRRTACLSPPALPQAALADQRDATDRRLARHLRRHLHLSAGPSGARVPARSDRRAAARPGERQRGV